MTKSKGGRPSSYKPEYVIQVQKLCVLGATDVDIADFFGVAVSTVSKWKHDHPEFSEALKSGKDAADERVERSLYHKAVGYTFDAIHFSAFQGVVTATPYREHVPPDTTAAIFWLKNRRSDRWRDVHKVEHGQAGDFDNMSDKELEETLRSKAVELGVSVKGASKTAH